MTGLKLFIINIKLRSRINFLITILVFERN